MRNKFLLVVAAALLIATTTSTSSAQAPTVTETMYILPKRNMNDKLEAAIKAHNTKFHPEGGSYAAGLRSVDYGVKAGWYVWLMGPTAYASIDSRPDKGAHDDDWTKTVDPLIEEYGATELWETDADLSIFRDMLLMAGHYDIWAVDVKRGEMEHFNELLGKVKKTYESMGNRAFLVYRNVVHSPGCADVAIVTSYKNMADWGADWKVKEAYEKINGDGSWGKMLETWNELIVDYNEELRSFVK